jgi:hypothetical protein
MTESEAFVCNFQKSLLFSSSGQEKTQRECQKVSFVPDSAFSIEISNMTRNILEEMEFENLSSNFHHISCVKAVASDGKSVHFS